jgi:hypothetical protein
MADSWTKSSTPIMNCLVLDRIFGRRTFMTSVILTVDDHPDTPLVVLEAQQVSAIKRAT